MVKVVNAKSRQTYIVKYKKYRKKLGCYLQWMQTQIKF